MRPRAPSGRGRAASGSAAFVSSADPKPAYWRIVHGRPRYMSAYGPRVNGKAPGGSAGPEASSGP